MKVSELHNLSEDVSDIDDKIDYIITCMGSDKRVYESLSIIKKAKSLVENQILFDFKERFEKLDRVEKVKYSDYPKIANNIEIVNIDGLDEFQKIIISIKGVLKNADDKSIIYIDITGFIKPHFFMLIKALKLIIVDKKLKILYTEPEYYKFNKNLYDEFEYLKGSLDIISIPGFIGSTSRGQDKILTILLGFEGNISSEIYEDVAPSNLHVVNGLPSYLQKFKDISILNNSRLIANSESITYANANDPFKMYNKLSLIKSKNKSKTIVVAPLGTKPMALGACFFALNNPDVRVIYPYPENFNNSSNGNCSNCWLYIY